MQMPFGPNDPNSLPAMLGRMSPGMTPGPVPAQQLTPGFRAPGTMGSPGMPQQPQVPGMGMDPASMAALMAALGSGPGENENKVNGMLDATGTSDPMAQAAAQSADMQGGMLSWLKGAMKGLF